MRNSIIIVVGLVAVGLTGGSGMTHNECELADWQAVGYEDGAQGRTSEIFKDYRENCAKHGMAPDFQAYQAGRRAGLAEYCQPTRGYNEGRRGAEYHGVCPANLEGEFLDNYFEGQALYELEYQVHSTAREIERRKARIKEIERELADMATDVFTRERSSEERAQQLVESKHLAEERVTLAKELKDLEKELLRHEEKLAAHQAQFARQH